MPPPKAKSQGSKATTGGALTALRAISAPKAEPETNASAVANKATFFMTIPNYPFFSFAVRAGPPARREIDCDQMSCNHSDARCQNREAKKSSSRRLFRHLGDF